MRLRDSLRAVLVGVLVGYGYVFMEWLFFVTKPSFLREMGWWERLLVLFGTGGIVGVLVGGMTLGVVLVSFGLGRVKGGAILEWVGYSVAGVVIAVGGLLLVDNFTYTLFRVGVVTAEGLWRVLYVIGLVFGVWFGMRFLREWMIGERELIWIVLVLLGLSVVAWGVGYVRYGGIGVELAEVGGEVTGERPHILLITSDGVSASHLSLYGYERETTPFLSAKAGEFLVVENAFPNASTTTFSLTSLLAGRDVVALRMRSVMSVLGGRDSYEHLPGFLRRYGYRGVQLGVPVYVDAYMVNMQGGFEEVNGRRIDDWVGLRWLRSVGQADSVYFLVRLVERAGERLLHIFFIRQMVSPFQQVTTAWDFTAEDERKIDQALQLLAKTRQPTFIHVHLMSTRGPLFSVHQPHFSQGEEQNTTWMVDFYDDTLLNFDRLIQKIYHRLSELGLLEQTVLVIGADHGMQYQIVRVPLLIRFPGGRFAGRIGNNVQNLDIAPTLVDYLGLEVPGWMEGVSLLRGEPEAERVLVVGARTVVECEWVYVFDGDWWLVRRVAGHTRPCGREVKTIEDVPERVVERFGGRGEQLLSLGGEEGELSRRVMVRVLFLELGKGVEGLPEAEGLFADVPVTDGDVRVIEYAYREGWLEACGEAPLRFCPEHAVRREEAAVALLRGVFGREYHPPAPQGVFADVPVDSPYAPWVEDLYRRKITSGCSQVSLMYCPEQNLLFSHFLVFLSKLRP